jgi:hypothetical protein
LEDEPVCYTTLGEEGRCAMLRECYPMLYADEFGRERVEIENPTLVETLKTISGPCDMPNFSKFRVGNLMHAIFFHKKYLYLYR